MSAQPSPRHFLDINQFSSSTLRLILNKAIEFKKAGKNSDKPLLNHTLVLIFEKSSTRTRVSFEVGMRQLGGDVVVLGIATPKWVGVKALAILRECSLDF